MSINERLSAAGLSEEFDTAAFADDEAKIRQLLLRLDLDADAATRTMAWVRDSPYSPYNRHPIDLPPELKADARLSSLDRRSVRIIQHLFDSHGGAGTESCAWKDCDKHALKGSAFCGHCAQMNAPSTDK